MAGQAEHRGKGHVRQLPSGNWQASFTGPDGCRYTAPTTFRPQPLPTDSDPPTPQQRAAASRRAKAAAEAWVDQQLAQMESISAAGEDWSPPKQAKAEHRLNRTFAEFALEWLDKPNARTGRPKSAKTVYDYRLHLDGHLLPVFGKMRLRQITPEMVAEWHSGLLKATPGRDGKPGRSRSTYRARVYGTMKTIMLAAKKAGEIAESPCLVDGAGSVPPPEDKDLPGPGDMLALSLAMPDKLRLAVTLGATLGLRSAEVRALRRQDVDLARGVLRVRHSLNQVPGGTLVAAPKTAAGHRGIPLPAAMVPVISAHLEKFTDKRPDGWLFPGANRTQADGPPIHQSSFFKAWNRARKTAGIPEFRFHDLRHHAASHLAAAGLTDVEVMRILGQRSGEAFRRYLDRIRGRELAAIETATARSGLVAGKAES